MVAHACDPSGGNKVLVECVGSSSLLVHRWKGSALSVGRLGAWVSVRLSPKNTRWSARWLIRATALCDWDVHSIPVPDVRDPLEENTHVKHSTFTFYFCFEISWEWRDRKWFQCDSLYYWNVIVWNFIASFLSFVSVDFVINYTCPPHGPTNSTTNFAPFISQFCIRILVTDFIRLHKNEENNKRVNAIQML